MKHLSKCYEIPPPAVQPGPHVVVFIVGLMHQLRTSIHKDLIFAASSEVRARYARHPEDKPCPPFVMDDVDPSVFQVLWDWLYVRNVAEEYQSNLENDYFWYAVFKMAERLRIPAVMLTAWKRFQLCFSLKPSNSKSQGRIMPSHVLLNILFRSSNPEIVFRDWIVTHVLWHSTYNSLYTSGDIEILLDDYTELAARYGRLHSKVNTQQADTNGYKFSHPGLDLGFAATHGFDLDTYRSAALDQTTQHEDSKEDKSEARRRSLDSHMTDETIESDEGHISEQNPASQSALEPRVELPDGNISDDHNAFHRARHRSIQSISDDEREPSTKSEAGIGERRSKRGVPRFNYSIQDVFREQYGL
ncbi:hypothetical protein LTR70_005769 [Exophiala xenobiotica]|uniref:BTB domain-containing protein n=1 Tax=Lithohypha guttulata TaxID=1690604 RepID=A0ABR0K8V7_9EURO|nr:hypothetical protein LTR24_005506 [Lithohypha guttulata]KAK5317663.1 hypothetical protein LTR70_005769 [Exophiala xenobiotica]